MNQDDTTTQTQPTPPTTAPAPANPAADPDGPPINTAPVLTPQEQIDAEAEAEMKAELKRLLGNGDGGDGQTPADGGNATTPQVEQPDAIATPPGETQETPPATPAEGGTHSPTDGDGDPAAKAKRDAERAAYGKLGGRISQLEAKIAEKDAKLEELMQRLGNATDGDPATQAAPPDAPPKRTPPADIETAEITDEERKQILGESWEADWGKEGADEEIRKARRSWEFYARKFGGGTDEVKKQVQAEIAAERETARQDSAVEAFFAGLDKAVPSAAQLQRDADSNGFGAFLDDWQPGTMTTRRQVVAAAIEAVKGGATGAAFDRAVNVVADIFKQFQTPSPRQDGLKRAETIDPARYAVPRVTGASNPAPAADTQQNGKVWSEKEVDAALSKAAADPDPGTYEKVQAWAEKLYREGRVKK